MPRIRRSTQIALWLLVLIYIVTYSVLSVLKHDNYYSFTFDLGIMSQVIWNTAHGRFFEVSLGRPLDTELVGSYLGNHVRPIILLLAPLYRVWADPRLLLILQSVALGFGAVPLFWIARRELSRPWLSMLMVIAYLAYPALGYINLFDFHPVAFSIPFLFVAYWALLEKRPTLFWAMIVLTLATKEEMVIPIAAFGLYCAARREWRKTGLWLLALSILWAFLCFIIIIPCFNEGRSYRFFSLWSHLPTQVLSGHGDGQSGLSGWMSPNKIVYLAHLLLPLGFLPLLDPGLLAVSLPSLAYLLLGSRPALHSIGFQYPAVLIPWWFLAAVRGLARLKKMRRHGARLMWVFLSLLLVGSIGMNAVLNPFLFYRQSRAFRPTEQHEEIKTALAQISPESGVVTINALGPHLAHRRYLISLDKYPEPLGQDRLQYVDFVLLDLVDCRAVISGGRAGYTDSIMGILKTGEFRVRYWSDRVVLLERGSATEEELAPLVDYVAELNAQNRACWP
jgi:uncharacterized membrane protein